MMRVLFLLTLSLAAFVAIAAARGAAPASNVVIVEGPVDDTPDAAFADRVRVDFVGCRDLRDTACARLAHFRFEYGWESASRLEARLEHLRAGGGADAAPVAWTSFRTDPLGRAGLPLPGERAGTHVLHVRLNEPGWDWYTFPGPIHPGTLEGAVALPFPEGTRNLRVTLVRGS